MERNYKINIASEAMKQQPSNFVGNINKQTTKDTTMGLSILANKVHEDGQITDQHVKESSKIENSLTAPAANAKDGKGSSKRLADDMTDEEIKKRESDQLIKTQKTNGKQKDKLKGLTTINEEERKQFMLIQKQ